MYKSYVIMQIVMSSLLSIFFLVSLIKELLGERFKVIVIITGMMFLSNALLLGMTWADIYFFPFHPD